MSESLWKTERMLVGAGENLKLKKRETRDKCGLKDKKHGAQVLAEEQAKMRDLQQRLYAEGMRSLLVVLQATDTGGKDGTIRRVFGPLNPQGVRVTSFKRPSGAELAHDYLWRIHRAVPDRGMIGVFNRSHYEDVLVARVRGLAPKDEIERRYRQIADFERHLAENGVRIVKIMLHISKDEQRERLQARLDDPEKRWKFDPGDLAERKRWDDHQRAFEIALERTSVKHAPWYVVPADRKWVRNVMVARIVREALEAMAPRYPEGADDLADVVLA